MTNIDIFDPQYINGLMNLKTYEFDYTTLSQHNKEMLVVLLNELGINPSLKPIHINNYLVDSIILLSHYYNFNKHYLRINNKYSVEVVNLRHHSFNHLNVALNAVLLEFENVQKVII